MKDLLVTVLDEAKVLLDKQTPKIKNKLIGVNIDNVNPIDLNQFMDDKNIPKDAWFGTEDCQTLGGCTDVMLYYNVEVPTTDFDRNKFCNNRFGNIVFPLLYKVLTSNGYTRVGVNSGLFKQYDDKTIYQRYMEKDIDKLVEYYSLYFKKI